MDIAILIQLFSVIIYPSAHEHMCFMDGAVSWKENNLTPDYNGRIWFNGRNTGI